MSRRPRRVSSRRAAVLLGIVLTVATVRSAAAAGPTDQIRGDVTTLYAALSRGADPSDILDHMFDWTRMARTALRDHWERRTASEREEFTQLFAGVFQRAYVSRAHVIDASQFQYLGDTRRDSQATVRTKVRTKRGSAIDVDYAVRLDGDRWRVEDILVERVSLVENYRTQFDAVLARSSYVALAGRLRALAK